MPSLRSPWRSAFPVVPCRGGEAVLRRLFEPLGYEVRPGHSAGRDFPCLGRQPLPGRPTERHHKVKDLLEHLYVLLPVLDDDKHYWVGPDEVEKLLRRGGEWLAAHPERELIANRYLRHDRHLTREAMARCMEDDPVDPDEVAEAHDAEEEAVEGRSA